MCSTDSCFVQPHVGATRASWYWHPSLCDEKPNMLQRNAATSLSLVPEGVVVVAGDC